MKFQLRFFSIGRHNLLRKTLRRANAGEHETKTVTGTESQEHPRGAPALRLLPGHLVLHQLQQQRFQLISYNTTFEQSTSAEPDQKQQFPHTPIFKCKNKSI